MSYSLLTSHYSGELGFRIGSVAHGYIDGAGGSACFHLIDVVYTIGRASFACHDWCAQGILVIAAGGIENLLFLFCYGLHLGIAGEGFHVSFDEVVLYQEAVKFLCCGCNPCIADAEACFFHLGIGLCLLQMLDGGFQSTASEGAEGYDVLALKVVLLHKGCDGSGVCAVPDGVA